MQTGYVTPTGGPEAPCSPETMYKRNGLMASVLVTSATPQVWTLAELGQPGGVGTGGEEDLLLADSGPS